MPYAKINKLLFYQKETGILFWRYDGSIAGTETKLGYFKTQEEAHLKYLEVLKDL